MNAQEMWVLYSAKNSINADYQAWSFGDDPDELAGLVLEGIKTATTSAFFWYEQENQELPGPGDYSVILDQYDNAVCIIQTTKVYVTPFADIGEDHAYKEGEGDRSLQYWRNVHQDFFKAEFSEAGLTFHDRTKVVCEEFVRVFP